MKAIVYEKYGSPDVLKIKDVAKPVPSDDQLLIKIHAVSINGSDKEGLVGKPGYVRFSGLFKPSQPILGSDIAGTVETVGANNTEFKVGDEVFGEIPGYHGGFAEYAVTHGRTLMLKPKGMTFEEASAIPQAGVIALKGIRDKGQVKSGQEVLINGAGGSAGTFAVQIAKLYGAEVTGVDNTYKQDFLQSLGVDHVIDYTKEDFTKTGKQYDLILDVIAHRSPFAYARALKPNGAYFVVGGSLARMLHILLMGSWIKRTRNRNVRILAVPQHREGLIAITDLIQAGKVRPIIDKTYAFDEIPEAMRYVTEGRAKGKVVITVK